MRSRKKSPEDRYSFGSDIQKRAKCLLEALLDYGDEALKFGNGFKQEEIEVMPLHSGQNGAGLKFKVKRDLLARLSGIKTENLNKQEAKNLYDQVRNVVSCLDKFKIISYYSVQKTGWWELILPNGDKNKLIKMLPAFIECKEALVKPRQASGEAVDASVRELSPEQEALEQSQPNYPFSGKQENTSEASKQINAFLIQESFFKLASQNSLDWLGAVLSLQGIATRDDCLPDDFWRIMKYLTAFIRTNAPRKKEEEGEEKRFLKRIPDYIQEALTVIVQRDLNQNEGVLDLSNTDLRGAKFSKPNLHRVNLRGSNLKGVSLFKANLQGANLQGANLQKTRLWEAELEWAKLCSADLRGASLHKANLQRADLRNTKLHGTNFQRVNLHKACLRGVDLTGVKNLKLKQIASADGDSTTRLPENLNLPEHWIQAKPLPRGYLLKKVALELRQR
jgi:uncharacterized protein YjbI with pentapeptide repeats